MTRKYNPIDWKSVNLDKKVKATVKEELVSFNEAPVNDRLDFIYAVLHLHITLIKELQEHSSVIHEQLARLAQDVAVIEALTQRIAEEVKNLKN